MGRDDWPLAGSLLFAVAAFVPRAALLHPRRAERLAAAGVLGILALAIAIPQAFGAGLPQVITMSAGRIPIAACMSMLGSSSWRSRRRCSPSRRRPGT